MSAPRRDRGSERLRRALLAAAEASEGDDGLERIRARMHAPRPATAAWLAAEAEPSGLGRVWWEAGRLAGVAARLLPARDRCRFAEEYRSELWELAQGGAPRRRQVAHAVRLLGSSVALRVALGSLRRRSAAP
jgi:hypothetical protein